VVVPSAVEPHSGPRGPAGWSLASPFTRTARDLAVSNKALSESALARVNEFHAGAASLALSPSRPDASARDITRDRG
jgi:hypothetical protein